jgi:RNA polymerase sigma-70 factor, ECF subfamily
MEPPRRYPTGTTEGPEEGPPDARITARRREEEPFQAAIRSGHAAGASAWPGVSVSAEELAAYVAERLPEGEGEDAAAQVSKLQIADLYLACACARGDVRAIQCFEQAYFGEVARAFRRARASEIQQADLEQMLREKLFVAGPGEAPKITGYAGSGPLRLWVRAVATRTLHNLVTRGPKETALDPEALANTEAAIDDPELEHMRGLYRGEFKQAFAEALSAMSYSDRLLLHRRFEGQRTLDELAAAYDVHTNTIARWLGRARHTLETKVKQSLAGRLALNEVELASVLRLIRSQLDVTLGRLLEGKPEDP